MVNKLYGAAAVIGALTCNAVVPAIAEPDPTPPPYCAGQRPGRSAQRCHLRSTAQHRRRDTGSTAVGSAARRQLVWRPRRGGGPWRAAAAPEGRRSRRRRSGGGGGGE